MNDAQSRDSWERTRTLEAIVIQPHLKPGTKITPKQLMPMPWDEETRNHRSEAPQLTAEEKRKQFEKIVATCSANYP